MGQSAWASTSKVGYGDMVPQSTAGKARMSPHDLPTRPRGHGNRWKVIGATTAVVGLLVVSIAISLARIPEAARNVRIKKPWFHV